MRKTTLVMAVVTVGSALSACAPKEPVQTVDWYKTHTAERDAMIARCDANPGELESTPNCINATDARNAKTWASRAGITAPKAPTFGKQPPVKAANQ
jgi:hypothetical protein